MSLTPHADPASSAPLAALVYKSRATEAFDSRSLGDLVARAQTRNASEGLTGAVYYDNGRFLQWLEGPANRLDAAAVSISRDERHTDLELLSYGFVQARMYSGWTMRLLTRKPARSVAQAPNRCDGALAPTIAARGLAAGDDRAAHAFLALAPATAAGAVAQCEKIAAAYLPLWHAELCDDIDITNGLSHLLRLFRRFTASVVPAHRALASRILVASAPGERHFVGAAFAAEFLLERGFIVDYLLPATGQELLERIAASPLDGVVLASSPVFSRAERSGDLARLAAGMCKAHVGRDAIITIYGRAPATLCGPYIRRVTSRAADIDPDRSALVAAERPMNAGLDLLH